MFFLEKVDEIVLKFYFSKRFWLRKKSNTSRIDSSQSYLVAWQHVNVNEPLKTGNMRR